MVHKRKILYITMSILIILCFAANIFLLTRPGVTIMPIIGTILNLLALTSAAIYCISGYKKKSQIFYKGFFLFYALHLLTGTAGMLINFSGETITIMWVLAFEITFANLLMLFIPDDFGERKSKVVAVFNACLWAVLLIQDFIFKNYGTIGIYSIRIASYLISAILVALLVYVKYEDKKERKPFDAPLR